MGSAFCQSHLNVEVQQSTKIYLMALSNTQVRYFDSRILRLPADKRSEYHVQVDRLISSLKEKFKDETLIKITKVVKAGSFAKHTILRKTSTDPVDVDVVFYITDIDANGKSLEEVNELIYSLLIKLYPAKAVEDFEIQRKAATVKFVGSGLSVDIVPVVEDTDRPGYGWQYDIHDGSQVVTCAPCQIKFVKDRKDIDADYRTLVRMLKKWRNYVELKPLKSFTVELITAHVLDKNGTAGSIEQRFRNVLLYIAQSELKEELRFPENTAPFETFSDSVVILDPINSQNNVTSRITENERIEIVSAAQEAWEAATLASTEDDYTVWKELFGPRFRTED